MLSLAFLSIIVLVLNASVSLAARSDGGPRWPSNHGYVRPRQLASTYPITGIQQSSIQPRLEIRQLQEDFPDTFNVYLLGLQKFQQVDQSDPLSWYGIAGIHGRPYIPWDGVNAGPGLPGYPGFCHHVSNLLLSWHRPYLALYEQVLYQHILEVVNEFPEGELRQRYATAASTWRIPYWDWAAPPQNGQSVYASVLAAPTVQVTTPSGVTEIANPLFSYKFHPVSAKDFYWQPFASWSETLRSPDSQNVSQNDLIASTLDNNRPSFMSRLYNLLTTYDDFTQFETYAAQDPRSPNADSLESIHDAIHGITGGNGHMTYLDYSAFDPLFMLHHAMVDRVFAIWQALHPDSYVEPMTAVEQTYTTAMNTLLDGDSPLQPFHSSSNGTTWTSNSVRSTEQLGYTYPEVANNADQSSIRAAVNALYAGDQSGQKASTFGRLQMAAEASTADSSLPTDHYRSYTANINSRKFAFNGSYAVYVFLGDVADENAAAWPLASNLVGTQGVFTGMTMPVAVSSSPASTDGTQDSNEAVGGNVMVTGTVPLTNALLKHVQTGDLASLEVDDVRAFLRKNLQWRIGKYDGTAIDDPSAANLSITIVMAEVQPARAADQFPVSSNFSTLDAEGPKLGYI